MLGKEICDALLGTQEGPKNVLETHQNSKRLVLVFSSFHSVDYYPSFIVALSLSGPVSPLHHLPQTPRDSLCNGRLQVEN